MKKLSVLAILMVASAPAWAGGIGIGGTYWGTDEADDGTGVGLRLTVDLSDRLDFDVRVGFLEELSVSNAPAPPLALEATPIDLGLAWNFLGNSRVTPRVGGGMSYVMYEVKGSNVNSEVDDEVGFYGLLGVDFAFGSRGALYLEGLYRSNEGELRDFGLDQFDRATFTASGAAANFGVMFTW